MYFSTKCKNELLASNKLFRGKFLMKFQTTTSNDSFFQYIEIEHNCTISENKEKFDKWLFRRTDTAYLERIMRSHFGTYLTLVNYGDFKIPESENIVKVINEYATKGWEVINVRHDNLVYSPNLEGSLEGDDDDDEDLFFVVTQFFYSTTTIYTLKKSMTSLDFSDYQKELRDLRKSPNSLLFV
jgi:hypothetical protein